ncbi:MAG: glycosyltransferase family 4 protein [Thermomicrobiales bacterium]
MTVSRPSILLVSPVVPALTGNGLAMRAGMTLRALAEQCQVSLLIVERYPSVTGKLAPGLRALCERVDHVRHGPGLQEFLAEARRELEGEIDIVHFFRLSTFAHTSHLRLAGAQIHLDLDDIESHSRPRIAEVLRLRGRDKEARIEEQMAAAAMGHEIAALLSTDRVYVASDLDRDRLPICGTARIGILPNVVDIPPAQRLLHREQHRPFTFLFAGTLSYFPNEDGIQWFCEEVLPQLRSSAALPVRILVAGMAPAALRRLATSTGVEMLGWVEDLEQVYHDADAVIVPLRAGGGTRIKFLEAAARLLPVVATSIGAEGIAVEDQRECLIADEPGAFAQACLRLMDDSSLRAHLADRAFQVVESRYTIRAMIEALTPA